MPESLRLWFENDLINENLSNSSEADLIYQGGSKLRKSFRQEIAGDYNKTHIVPLSGGLDSRAVLANLLEFIEPTKIIAVTFGLPGSIDYERGKSIAAKARVKWESIDLSPGKWKWNTQLLFDTAIRSERPTWLFDTAINHAIQMRYGKDVLYWSGFMGDSLGCIEPVSKTIKTWEDAKAAFVKKNCISKNQRLTDKTFNPLVCLPPEPFAHPGKLDYYSQLNHCIKQQCLTKHIYSPKNYIIRYPFLNSEWVNFIINIPENYGFRQLLYRKILQSSWPSLFNRWNCSFRDSSRFEALISGGGMKLLSQGIRKIIPRLIRVADNYVNYIDWKYALMNQEDFKDLVDSNLQDLKNRQIIEWLDIEKLRASHHYIKNDLTRELMTLAALEIHLKAGTIQQNKTIVGSTRLNSITTIAKD